MQATPNTPLWIILTVVGVVIMSGVVSIVIGLVVANRRRGPWKVPERTGPLTTIYAVGPKDVPLTSAATWQGDELVVRADKKETLNLFDVPVSNLEQCVVLYRFRIRVQAMKEAMYSEMWCHVAGKGKFFSRGLDQKVIDSPEWRSAEWRTLEIPFYLNRGQQAQLLNLNVVFEGPGLVSLKDIEVQSAPVKEA